MIPKNKTNFLGAGVMDEPSLFGSNAVQHSCTGPEINYINYFYGIHLSLSKANGLTVGKEVFTINEHGEHGIARLHSKIEDSKGTKYVWEVPQYFNENTPAIKPVYVENITHVEKYKNREEAGELKLANGIPESAKVN